MDDFFEKDIIVVDKMKHFFIPYHNGTCQCIPINIRFVDNVEQEILMCDMLVMLPNGKIVNVIAKDGFMNSYNHKRYKLYYNRNTNDYELISTTVYIDMNRKNRI